ncbi:hypothetical protein [Ruegeria sp. HKCCA5763]|uniref:hypothetical protein n=1 Tax=Ruegeria sp. HKCCA5763 TaxID=2682987 RepID=UPI001489A985|nr:hypothetical protein [Ruegeria sp. HKCCA5763]
MTNEMTAQPQRYCEITLAGLDGPQATFHGQLYRNGEPWCFTPEAKPLDELVADLNSVGVRDITI